MATRTVVVDAVRFSTHSQLSFSIDLSSQILFDLDGWVHIVNADHYPITMLPNRVERYSTQVRDILKLGTPLRRIIRWTRARLRRHHMERGYATLCETCVDWTTRTNSRSVDNYSMNAIIFIFLPSRRKYVGLIKL